MSSTPDEPVPPTDEPGASDVRPPDPLEPGPPAAPPPHSAPGPTAPPPDAQLPPPGPVISPQNPYAAGGPQPGPPYPGQPYPGQPYPGQQSPMGYPPAGWQQPPTPPRRPLSFGAGLGIGIGIGIAAHVVAITLMFAAMNAFPGVPGPILMLWPYVLVALVAVVMMFFAKTRSFATGILIIAAAMWLTVIGPCIALIGMFSG